MLTAKKFVAACLRLLAFGSIVYLVFMLIASHLMAGHLGGGIYVLFLVWGIVSAFLFVYAIPLAGILADDIDKT